jgi:hypothetical protein
MKQRTLDGCQSILDKDGIVLLEQPKISQQGKFLWVVDEYMNRDQVKDIVSHLDYWLITGKLFREESDKPAVQPDITQAGV